MALCACIAQQDKRSLNFHIAMKNAAELVPVSVATIDTGDVLSEDDQNGHSLSSVCGPQVQLL